jgi:uncharacterized membrane protein (DUF4010 family)
MQDISLFYRFGAALAIGFLVGLQREVAYDNPEREMFAGVRTFSLIGLLGCGAALVAEELSLPWAFVVVLLVLASLITVAYFFNAQQGKVGLTTEVSALLTLLAGALCYWEYLPLAAALAVATTVLLALKPEMRSLAQRITREDVYATLKFAVITAIILPVLPNRAYGPPPMDVLNPYEVWLMVVFISGISFLGYILIQLLGPQQGISLTGLLGGMVSSTPVTLSFTRRSQEKADLAKPFALAITVAWAITFLRVVVEVAALNAELLEPLWPPLVAASAAGVAYCGYLYLSQRTDEKGDVAFSNPFELSTALQFGLIYAVALIISRAAQVYLGDTGVYVSGAMTGLADADAVTLSMAQLSRDGGLDPTIAARAVVLGAMANTGLKGAIVLIWGSPGLRRAVLPGLVLMLVGGLGVAFVF